MGIVPFSGELREGATSNGVNRNSLSAYAAAEFQKSLKSYASQFHVNEEKAEVVERFIKSKRRILNLTQEYIESFDSYDEAYGETMNSMNPNTGLDC